MRGRIQIEQMGEHLKGRNSEEILQGQKFKFKKRI